MRAVVITAVGLVFATSGAQAQQAPEQQQAVVRNAESAAPAAIAARATIVDLQHNVLREGGNGFVCMPDDPGVPNNSPMCLDANWREFIDALMNRREPRFTGLGIAYMLQDDMPVSNTDPFATGPAAGNEWLPNAGPHIMIIVSDARLLEGLPTDPANGGPWVMWKGTPYAHIMIPTVRREK